MKYKKDRESWQNNFVDWWHHYSPGRPLLRVITRKENPEEPLEEVKSPQNYLEKHLGVEYNVSRMRNYCRTHNFLAEAYPSLDLNIGPGSMAVYLGSEPVISEDTIWYKEIARESLDELGKLQFDPDNYWWQFHLDVINRAQEEAADDFLVNIPDIIENLDIMASLRGSQALCYDLIDYPEQVKKYLKQLEELYFVYYNSMYEIVKDEQGGSSFTAFDIWGPGKTAKLQCDFSAMMSPQQFREFVQPYLRRQCQGLDFTIYHLDGPDAIVHLDALMEIDELDALQWTPGAGNPGGGNSCWYKIYDRVKEAGKSLHISIHDGNYEDWLEKATKIVNRYGCDGLYLLFPEMTDSQGEQLLEIAETQWN